MNRLRSILALMMFLTVVATAQAQLDSGIECMIAIDAIQAIYEAGVGIDVDTVTCGVGQTNTWEEYSSIPTGYICPFGSQAHFFAEVGGGKEKGCYASCECIGGPLAGPCQDNNNVNILPVSESFASGKASAEAKQLLNAECTDRMNAVAP